MPQYFTLQEALLAAQTASSDYKPKMSGGPKATAEFIQKKDSEIKPIVKGTTAVIEPEVPVEPAPIIKEPEVDPNIAEREKLERLIQELRDQKAAVPIDENAPEVDGEIFREPPSLIKGSSFVLIDPIREDAQLIHGAQEAQNLYDRQNKESVFVKPFAKKAAETRKILPKVATNIAESIRHPIAKLQNMVRDPFENRDINFSYAVNDMVKKSLFPNNPEMALLIPDSFIVQVLQGGREKRNTDKGKLGKNWSAIKDFMLWNTTGFTFDTQQKRALEYLKELIDTDPQGLLKQIENATLDSATNLARRFSQTLTQGNDLLANQKILGDNRILLPGEKREVIKATDTATNQDIVEVKIKARIKPIIDGNLTLDSEAKKQLVEDITQIYIENIPKDKLDKNGKPKGEAAVDILSIVDELKKPQDRQYYIDHWSELRIISYLGESKGDSLGGQERFLTLNQKIAIACAKAGGKITNGWAGSAAIAAAKTGVYLGGFAVSYGLGATKFASRSSAGKLATAATWMLGPVWAGAVGGIAESYSDINTKLYKHESNVTRQLRQVSRDKALRESRGELDYVRSDLELATVKTVPANELTKNINQLILTNPNDFSSETKKNITQEELLRLVSHIAHARARIDLTMDSGTKGLDYKTSNWVSYNTGHEQEELTNLKAADIQAYARLLNVRSERPGLFATIPFLAESGGDLNKALDCMTTVIKVGLREGLPGELLDGSKPLSTYKSQKFYKQIFDASGIPETQTDSVFNYINSLRNTDVVGGQSISDWMKESESFRLRMKELKQIKKQRFWFAAGSSATTSAVFSGVKYGFEKGIEVAQQHFTPIDTSPQEAPTIEVKPTDSFIPLDHIFAKDHNGNAEIIPMWIEGKIHNVPVNFASDVHMKFDADGNIDLHDSDGDILNNFLVKDTEHPGAYVFNSSFKLDDQSQPVDLGQIITTTIEHKTVEVENGFSNLWQKAEDFRLVWGHSEHIRPDHDYIFSTGDQEHPYGIEIRFEDDNIRNPNDNTVTSLLSHFEDKSMAVIFEVKDLLGENKDGHLLVKDCIEKVDDGKGGYYFSLKLDPTSDETVTLADGTVTTMGEVAQAILNEKDLINHQNLGYPDSSEMSVATMDVFNLGNNGRTGHILMGYITEASGPKGPQLFGHQAIPGGDKQIFIPVHMASGTGQFDGDFQIANSTTTDTISQVLINKDGEITIPGIPSTPKEAPPTVENEPIAYTPLPGAYHSPQLNPAAPSSTPIPPSLISTSESIIDRNQFNKENRPTRVQNLEAKDFVDQLFEQHLSNPQNFQKIDEFIISRHFTPSQQRFLENPAHQNFIKSNIYAAVNTKNPALGKKIDGTNPHSLTAAEKQSLKNIILEVAKDEGYSEKEALIMTEFIVQQSFYDNLFWAVTELNNINAELERATQQLNNLPPPRLRVDLEDLPEHEITISELAGLIIEKVKKMDDKNKEKIDDEINQLTHKYIISELNPNEQKYFKDKKFMANFFKVSQRLAHEHESLMEKVFGQDLLTDEDKVKLKKIILELDKDGLNNNQKIAVYKYFVESNKLAIQLIKASIEQAKNELGEDLSEVDFEINEMDVDSTISYEQNRKAADQFIAILRDPKHLKTSPTWPENYLVHDYGFVFDRNNGGTVSNPELIGTRYHMPFATYSTNLIPNVSHANLVIRGPRLDPGDSKWKIIIYDPYQFKFREETLTAAHNQEEALRYIHGNTLWKKDYSEGKDDLYFDQDLELKPYIDALVAAKLPPFQQDMINCYPYCFFVGTMLNALKPGATEFKTQGIPQFFQDYQLNILDRDEVLKRLRRKDNTEPLEVVSSGINIRTEKVEEIKNSIFEKAGKRTKEEMIRLIDEVSKVHYKMLLDGNGKLAKTIKETEKLGFEKIVCDGGITFIPKGKGELVVVGDIHGDLATIKQVIDKKGFIDNMENGDKTMMLVFEGDILDRGKKDIESMEVILDLKNRYPFNVIVMKADHEGPVGSVSHHDYPTSAAKHYGYEKFFTEQLYNKILDSLPRMVVCGNGVVLVHGGPTYHELNLQQLARLPRDNHFISLFDQAMTWADPSLEVEALIKSEESIIPEISTKIEEARKAADHKIEYFGEIWHLDNLIKVKNRLELAKKNGFWFNKERIDSGKLIDAVFNNNPIYSEKGLQAFLDRIGGNIMIRGHQVTNTVDGGKPNPFSKNIFWTIHSTGKGSPDSAYSGREFNPSFAVFDLNQEVSVIDPIRNILSVW